MAEDETEGYGTWSNSPNKGMSRRQFLKTAIGAGAAATIFSLPGVNALADGADRTEPGEQLPENVDTYLKEMLGDSYEFVTKEQLLAEIITKGVVAFGEAHMIEKDMLHITDYVRDINAATNRPIIMAFERFESIADGDALSAVNNASGESAKLSALDGLFTRSRYTERWSMSANGYSSDAKFEELVTMVALEGIPLVGLEIPSSEPGGLEDSNRNPGWVRNLEAALDRIYPNGFGDEAPLVITVSGAKHSSAEEGSFINLAKESGLFVQMGGAISIQSPYSPKAIGLSLEQRQIAELTDSMIVKRGGDVNVPDGTPAWRESELWSVEDYWVVVNDHL